MVPQSELTPEVLCEKIGLLYDNREAYAARMREQGFEDSLSTIIGLIEKYARP